MITRTFLLVEIGKASALAVVGCLTLAMIPPILRLTLTHRVEEVLGAMVFLPAGAAAYWLFRSLQNRVGKREAKRIAAVFGVSTPFSIAVSLFVATLAGGLVGYLGSPFALLAAVVSVFLLTAILNTGSCLFMRSLDQRTRRSSA
jgi:hypothetical protein